MKISQTLKQIISLVFFIVIAVFLALYLKNHWQDFDNVEIVSWPAFIGVLVLTPIVFYITSWFFQVSLIPFKLKLPFREYFGLTMITLLWNYFIPFSGLGVRAVYLNKKYKFTYEKFLVTVAANWFTNFVVYSVLGIIALVMYYFRTQMFSWPLAIIFSSVAIVSLLTLWPIKKKVKNKTIAKILYTLELWRKYFKNKEIINKLLVITFYQFLLNTFVFYLAFMSFGLKISFFDTFLPNVLSLYSSLIRIIPISLGIYELSVTYPTTVLGLSIADGLLVSTLTRIGIMFWIFTLGLIFSYILVKPFKKEKKK